MTEHSFEYPADFEPEKHCSQWAMTDRACCPDGTHQRGCEIIQGYNKARNSHAPVPMTRREKLAFTAAVLLTFLGVGLVVFG